VCEACDISGLEGICTFVDQGDDPDEECDAESPESCGLTGVCDGFGACELYGATTVCSTGDPCTEDDYCDAGSHFQYPESCVSTCDGEGACGSCACVPAETTCAVGDGNQCCEATCDAAAGCGTAAGACDDVCGVATLVTGRACSGCGENGAAGTCGGGTSHPCGAATACQSATCGGVGYTCTYLDGSWAWRLGTACDDGDPCTHGDVCTATGCAGTAIDCSDTPCATRECNGTDTCTSTPKGSDTVCGTAACPPDYCQANAFHHYPEDCTRYCSGDDDTCEGCECEGAETACTTGSANQCCASGCDDLAGCFTAAGACADVCEAATLTTGLTCSGCGANGAAGTCGGGTVATCGPANACATATCGGVTYECRQVGTGWIWTASLCESPQFCQLGACVTSIPEGGCCEATDVPDLCEAGSSCMELGDEDTCMADPTWPQCWTNGDCTATQTCEGEVVCTCMQDCISQFGLCKTSNFDCVANGGQCVNSWVACQAGYSQNDSYTCPFTTPKCCLPNSAVYKPWIEVTGPSPVPAGLANVTAYPIPTTPEPVVDLPGRLVAVGAVQSGNQDGCSAYTFTSTVPFIALVRRGNCQFVTKVTNATNAGALAVIIYNNVAGLPTGWTATGSIPALGIEQTPGDAMYTFASNNVATATATVHPF
jgi:hypothetical protein